MFACRKGEPNLTCRMFTDWVDAEYNTKVHESTAYRWLQQLGFCRVHHQKGVYFDGHDRDDVVSVAAPLRRGTAGDLVLAVSVHTRKHVLRKIEDEEEISLETCRIDV